MKSRDTRRALIEEGQRLFLDRGFEGIGLQALLASAGVPKGSFYNFFASKEAFAIAVVDAYTERYGALRDALFSGEGPPLARLRHYFAALEAEVEASELTGGCLYGVLAQTSAPHSAALRRHLTTAFLQWQARLARLLEEARALGELPAGCDLEALAGSIIDAYEGALVRMRAEGSIAPVRRFRTLTLERLLR